MSAGESPEAETRWTLKYGDRIYGPYSFQAMQTYIAEGRIAGHSLIAPEGTPLAAADWRRADEVPHFTNFFALGGKDLGAEAHRHEGEQQEAEYPVTQTNRPVIDGTEARPKYGPGKGQQDRRKRPESSNFMIVLDVKSRYAGPLEQSIMSLGPAYKLAPNVWCVNAAPDLTAPALLNDLSQHIGSTDTIFVVDATRDRAAWNSRGPEVDAKIRKVWRRPI
ncbi:DUF4339 domain-containing protein [Parvibaculum sp.]|uniref:DUF4339 domain-containing protein n=1 Tax=Parvibaculum sp. TaxID=2024848 RepID=UPI000C93F2A3|nr:DUF4339 domain-containing protein [Parvibaculum sp.]MAB15496.1 hypothetical protein [Parvibaculum sp.]